MPNYNTTLQTNNSSLEEIITQLNNMPDAGEGLDTSDATATSGDILSGKTAYVDGEKITGTIATKTTSNLTANGATVIVPAGYYSAQASKAVSTATQATPTITINTNTGLITATATQTAGYVAAGTKSGTKQLAFQAAQTITPGTTNQTIASGQYLTGVQTIKGDANLVASNIVSGKSIFGVIGTATAGGSSGDTSIEDALVTKNITTYTNDRITTIGSYAFYYGTKLTSVSFPVCTTIGSHAFGYCISLTTVSFPQCTYIGSNAFENCSKLTSVSFPVCTSIGSNAFGYCTSLTTVSFPVCISIGSWAFEHCKSLTTVSFPVCTTISNYAFYDCSKLTSVSFPVCTSIGSNAFEHCKSLTTVSFPVCISIGSWAFQACSKLTSVYLGASFIATLRNSSVFYLTPMLVSEYTGSFGSIYVPASLVAAYKSATNWATYANRITAIPGSENEDESELITFTIDGIDYQAENGMTWDIWCNSEYSKGEFVLAALGRVCNNYGQQVCHSAGLGIGDAVSSDEIIISDATYKLG